MKLPNEFTLKYDKEKIDSTCQRIGSEITDWIRKTDESKEVIVIPVLRGGVFFFTDLVRKIDESIEVAPVRTWAYSRTDSGEGVLNSDVKIHYNDMNPAGRRILLVDDICDSGSTLEALSAYFLNIGATEVRSAALIKRELGNDKFQPDYVGFSYSGKEWFVGYGMNSKDSFRNLPDIYLIEGTGSK